MIKKHSEKIKKMELILPPAPKPAGVYRPTLVIDHFLYVSGQGPVNKDGSYIIGKVGSDLNKDEAKEAARQVGLTMLSTIIRCFLCNGNIMRMAFFNARISNLCKLSFL